MEKVVVPQFVADWYEENKNFTMYGLLKLFEVGAKSEQLVCWSEEIGKGEAQRVIAKMHLFQDYEVEEKKYYWRKKKEYWLDFEHDYDDNYINLDIDDNTVKLYDNKEFGRFRTEFTEAEIRELVTEDDFNKLEPVEIKK